MSYGGGEAERRDCKPAHYAKDTTAAEGFISPLSQQVRPLPASTFHPSTPTGSPRRAAGVIRALYAGAIDR